MSRIVEFRKKDERLVLRDRFEILQFANKEQQGGQSNVAFGIDLESANRLLTFKFYGLQSKIEDTSERVSFMATSREYAERLMNNEIMVLSPLGDALSPSIPKYIDHWLENDVPIVIMTNGRESRTALKENWQEGRFSFDDFKNGGVLTLEQIIYKRSYYGNQAKKIDEIYNWSNERKIRFFIDLLRALDRIHKDYHIVLNDIKPSQILVTTPKAGENSLGQIIDFASSIQIQDMKNIDDNPDMILSPTTIVYNNIRHLENYLSIMTRKRKAEDVVDEIRKKPEMLFDRDEGAMGMTGMEWILHEHPYFSKALKLIYENKKILDMEELKKSIIGNHAKSIDPQILSEIDYIDAEIHLEKIRCHIAAQEMYFDERKKPGYHLRRLDKGVSSRVERILHSMIKEPCSSGDMDVEEAIHEIRKS